MKRFLFILLAIAVVGGVLYFYETHNHRLPYERQTTAGVYPDPKLTPGVPRNVTLDTLCHTSTKLVRNVTAAEKRQVYAEYGMQTNHELYCDTDEKCEVDHLISLEIGGANDIGNLWPQPYRGEWNAHMKDHLENKLHQMVCNNEIPLAQAQHEIATDWITAYKKYVTE